MIPAKTKTDFDVGSLSRVSGGDPELLAIKEPGKKSFPRERG